MVNIKGCLKKFVNGILLSFLYVLVNFAHVLLGVEFIINVCDYALSTWNIYFAGAAGIQRHVVPCAHGL